MEHKHVVAHTSFILTVEFGLCFLICGSLFRLHTETTASGKSLKLGHCIIVVVLTSKLHYLSNSKASVG